MKINFQKSEIHQITIKPLHPVCPNPFLVQSHNLGLNHLVFSVHDFASIDSIDAKSCALNTRSYLMPLHWGRQIHVSFACLSKESLTLSNVNLVVRHKIKKLKSKTKPKKEQQLYKLRSAGKIQGLNLFPTIPW